MGGLGAAGGVTVAEALFLRSLKLEVCTTEGEPIRELEIIRPREPGVRLGD